MKQRLQLTPALGAAIICALLWFAFWLTAFQPQPIRNQTAVTYPPAVFLPSGAEKILELRAPTLFALPSKEGFSGTFPESRVNLELTLNQPDQPDIYLSRPPLKRTPPDQVSLIETVPVQQTPLPAPGIIRLTPAPRPERIAIFLSPSLQARKMNPLKLDIAGELPFSVRVYVHVRPDGSVDQALIETPAVNPALAGAVRQLRFAQAAEATRGWVDIRFTPEGGS